MDDFNDFEFVTKSEADADHFKFSSKRKLEVIEKCKLPYYMPIVIYVKNTNLPDLKKTVYIVHNYSTVDDILETVKHYLDYENYSENIEKLDTLNFGFRTEVKWKGEEDLLFTGDYPIQEIWEDYKNCGDKFLYLILDAE
jgi:hypothetical protein